MGVPFKHFHEFFVEEAIANTTGSVEGLRTEPVIRKKTQAKFIRRNAAQTPKIPDNHEYR
jgi:predicted aminopeptidase